MRTSSIVPLKLYPAAPGRLPMFTLSVELFWAAVTVPREDHPDGDADGDAQRAERGRGADEDEPSPGGWIHGAIIGRAG